MLLLSLGTTLVKYLAGCFGNQRWKKTDNLVEIVFTSLMDVQLLVGLILYFFLSPITRFALNDFSAALKESELRGDPNYIN